MGIDKWEAKSEEGLDEAEAGRTLSSQLVYIGIAKAICSAIFALAEAVEHTKE